MRDLELPESRARYFGRIIRALPAPNFPTPSQLKKIPLLDYHTPFNSRIVKKANCDSGQQDHNTFGTRLDLSLVADTNSALRHKGIRYLKSQAHNLLEVV